MLGRQPPLTRPAIRPDMFNLTTETPDDWGEVEALYDLCFAPGREALSSYRLRDGVDPVTSLSLVARDADGTLGGAIRYWPIRIAAARAGLWAASPSSRVSAPGQSREQPTPLAIRLVTAQPALSLPAFSPALKRSRALPQSQSTNAPRQCISPRV